LTPESENLEQSQPALSQSPNCSSFGTETKEMSADGFESVCLKLANSFAMLGANRCLALMATDYRAVKLSA